MDYLSMLILKLIHVSKRTNEHTTMKYFRLYLMPQSDHIKVRFAAFKINRLMKFMIMHCFVWIFTLSMDNIFQGHGYQSSIINIILHSTGIIMVTETKLESHKIYHHIMPFVCKMIEHNVTPLNVKKMAALANSMQSKLGVMFVHKWTMCIHSIQRGPA